MRPACRTDHGPEQVGGFGGKAVALARACSRDDTDFYRRRWSSWRRPRRIRSATAMQRWMNARSMPCESIGPREEYQGSRGVRLARGAQARRRDRGRILRRPSGRAALATFPTSSASSVRAKALAPRERRRSERSVARFPISSEPGCRTASGGLRPRKPCGDPACVESNRCRRDPYNRCTQALMLKCRRGPPSSSRSRSPRAQERLVRILAPGVARSNRG